MRIEVNQEKHAWQAIDQGVRKHLCRRGCGLDVLDRGNVANDAGHAGDFSGTPEQSRKMRAEPASAEGNVEWVIDGDDFLTRFYGVDCLDEAACRLRRQADGVYPFAEKLFRREHQGVGIGLMAFNEAVLQVQHEDEIVD